jgi:hypothetical protein
VKAILAGAHIVQMVSALLRHGPHYLLSMSSKLAVWMERQAKMRARLDLLSPTADHPGRHATLRAVLDWSYNLLGTAQRRLFDRLSVFAGGWSVAAWPFSSCSNSGSIS